MAERIAHLSRAHPESRDDVAALVAMMTAPDRDQRLATADETADRLEALAQQLGPPVDVGALVRARTRAPEPVTEVPRTIPAVAETSADAARWSAGSAPAPAPRGPRRRDVERGAAPPHGESYTTGPEATASIADYIDKFYSPRGRHSALGYVSPIEYEFGNAVEAKYGGVEALEQAETIEAAGVGRSGTIHQHRHDATRALARAPPRRGSRREEVRDLRRSSHEHHHHGRSTQRGWDDHVPGIAKGWYACSRACAWSSGRIQRAR